MGGQQFAAHDRRVVSEVLVKRGLVTIVSRFSKNMYLQRIGTRAMRLTVARGAV